VFAGSGQSHNLETGLAQPRDQRLRIVRRAARGAGVASQF
jgi:hypothetical protein